MSACQMICEMVSSNAADAGERYFEDRLALARMRLVKIEILNEERSAAGRIHLSFAAFS